jgi:hypothetical protein
MRRRAIGSILGVTWSGLCVGGKAEGQGIAIRRYFEAGQWKESRFEGNQEGGKAHGYRK